MKHTPGPWMTAATPDISCPAVTDAEGWIIAPRIESVENARLIAAAPDLLASLLAVLPHVPGHLTDNLHGRPWIEQARAAIAKATGA